MNSLGALLLALIGSLPICRTGHAQTPAATPVPLVLAACPFDDRGANDHDEDCLDDAAERQIASQFRPYFIFDTRENARRPAEPVVLYEVSTGRVRGAGACSGIRQLHLRYVYLFENDGGYAISFFCRDSHRGDNQTFDEIVTVDPTGTIFTLAAISSGAFNWPRDRMQFRDGHYPIAYLSAGKHHPYTDTRGDGHGARYSGWGCTEANNGRGAQILSVLDNLSTPCGTLNVGERRAHPETYFVGDLRPLGFPGENAWGTRPFCGGRGPNCGHETSSMQSVWQ